MSTTDFNKATQKVKEAMSRMNKNGLCFCFINLESMPFADLCKVAESSLNIKSGKDSYLCSGKFVCFVSYEENDILTDEQENSSSKATDNPENKVSQNVTNNRLNISINVPDSYYDFNTDFWIGHGEGGKSNPNYILGPNHPTNKLAGMVSMLSGGRKIDYSYAFVNEPYMGQTIHNYSCIEKEPFKAIDSVMKAFYDHMRFRKYYIDDEEEEDMGAIAEANGIEW